MRFQHSPGNGDALAFAARQLPAALADDGIVTFGLGKNEVLCRRSYLPPRGFLMVASACPMRMLSSIERLSMPAS